MRTIKRYLPHAIALFGIAALSAAWNVAADPNVADSAISAAIVVGSVSLTIGFLGIARDW